MVVFFVQQAIGEDCWKEPTVWLLELEEKSPVIEGVPVHSLRFDLKKISNK